MVLVAVMHSSAADREIMVPVTVQLPGGLLARARKKKATGEGRTLNSLVEEGLRLMLARMSDRARRRRPLRAIR
jgi:hypothetical protein